MKIIGVILATFGVGFVAFQNCQKAPRADDVVNLAAGEQNTSEKIDLQTQKISEISLIFQEIETEVRASNSFQMIVNKNLDINVATGEMIVTSELDNTGVKYCLSDALNNELVSILKASQICPGPMLQEGTLCAQVIVSPYAVIVADGQTYSLGGSHSSCGPEIDLCADQPAALHGFIASLKTKYKTLVCPK